MYSSVPNKRPGRNKRPGWKISEKLISVLVRINVLGGKIWKITVAQEQNLKQFTQNMKLISCNVFISLNCYKFWSEVTAIFKKFPPRTFIRTRTLINFSEIFHPGRLFRPGRLLGTLE